MSSNPRYTDLNPLFTENLSFSGSMQIFNNLTVSGIISSLCGNSNDWCSTFSTLSANSGVWVNTYTTLTANSARWESVYTTNTANSARWETVYTTTTTNSGRWEGNFCDRTVYLKTVDDCSDAGISVNANTTFGNTYTLSADKIESNTIKADKIETNTLIALTATTVYQNISVTELSGFKVNGDLTALSLPTQVTPGVNVVSLNGVGISATNYAIFDGDTAMRKLYTAPRASDNDSLIYDNLRSQFLDGYYISEFPDFDCINLNLGSENSTYLSRSNLYNKPISAINLYYGVASDVKSIKFWSRLWNGFGNPNYPWRKDSVGNTFTTSAMSGTNVFGGRNYGLGAVTMLIDCSTGNVGIGIPGTIDPLASVKSWSLGGGPGEGRPNQKLTVYGNISAADTGIIYAAGGNSTIWNNTYTNITASSGSWQNAYTNLTANSARWESVFTTNTANSARWNGNFCNETVYMTNLSGCWNSSLSTSLISISGNLNLNGYSISGVNNGVFNSSVLSRLITAQEIVVSGVYINSIDSNKKGHYQWNPEGSNSWNSEFTNRILVRKDSNLDGYGLATPAITIYNAITGENKTVQLAFAGQGYDLSEGTYPISIGGIIAKTGEQDTSYGFNNGSLNLYTVDKFGDRKDALIIDHTGQATFNYKISAPCGNSDQWCSNYTTTNINSAMWGSYFTATNTVGTSTVSITIPQSYTNAFFNIGVVSGTNIRSSQMMVAWDGNKAVFTENSTIDLGSTSAVTLSAGYSGSNIIIQSIITEGNWTIKGSKQLI